MSVPKIVLNAHEIEYKGLFFPFRAVRKFIEQNASKEYLDKFCIHKSFCGETGVILRKHSWESVFQDLNERGILSDALDKIIEIEYLE